MCQQHIAAHLKGRIGRQIYVKGDPAACLFVTNVLNNDRHARLVTGNYFGRQRYGSKLAGQVRPVESEKLIGAHVNRGTEHPIIALKVIDDAGNGIAVSGVNSS